MLKRIGLLTFTAVFLSGGYSQYKEPEGRADAASKIGLPATAQLVQATGMAMMVASAGLQLGPLRRLSALTLALLLLPATYVGHRSWELDGLPRKQQRTHFMKNASLLGGALYIAGTT